MNMPEVSTAARTSLWTAAARARENERPDRLFHDPFAAHLAGRTGSTLLKQFTPSDSAMAANPYIPVRTRWYDDFLDASELLQVVVLGAGMDTRAFRLGWPDGTVVFEIDDAALLDSKTERLASAGAPAARCDRRVVGSDLADDWSGRLLSAGYDPAVPTAWIAEGLLFYLPEALARDVVSHARRLSATGSALAADVLSARLLASPSSAESLRRLREMGHPWQFGTDHPAEFLQECGWRTAETATPAEVSARYGRPMPAPPTGARYPHSYLLAAFAAPPPHGDS
ncbi:SAM-dependent methyltransferase [Streptomyces sp. ID01-9D]|uniref:SAM-dependent methyltransferase n=1 Tax=Streptomyces sp. ID01-9D TaxID=3028659 RepID=UPI0029CA251A|nr:SAM-dependent methyltransferase [Streptomyces sp. ID01-9D]